MLNFLKVIGCTINIAPEEVFNQLDTDNNSLLTLEKFRNLENILDDIIISSDDDSDWNNLKIVMKLVVDEQKFHIIYSNFE